MGLRAKIRQKNGGGRWDAREGAAGPDCQLAVGWPPQPRLVRADQGLWLSKSVPPFFFFWNFFSELVLELESKVLL